MTYDEFWHGDPWLAKTYRAAYVERRKEENIRDWMQGAYFYNAVATALSNAFRKKGAPLMKYAEEPFQIFPLSEEEQEAKTAKENARIHAAMMAQAARFRAAKAAQEQQHAEITDPNAGDSPEHNVIEE